jgi:hypothetical protein
VRTAKGDDMPIAAALDIAITVLESDAVPASPGAAIKQTDVQRALIWMRKLRSMALASAARAKDESNDEPQP